MNDQRSTQAKEAPLFRAAFGVGCWDFRLRHGSLLQVSSKNQYVDLLKKGLEDVSSLNNLEILPFGDGEIKIDKRRLPETDAGQMFFVRGLLRHIKFDLYIPFRIQKELGRHMYTSPLRTENFRIHIHYPYYGPVSYVELVGDENLLHPSNAMAIVREYMKSQLSRLSSDVVFAFVGPTPFHANFQLEGYTHYDSTDNVFGCEKLDKPGYADVTFRCRADDFSVAGDACEALFRELDHELDLFYEIRRRDFRNYKRWGEIEKRTSNLTEHFKKVGWRERFRATRARGRELADLYTSLVRFEADHIVDQNRVDEGYRSTYERQDSTFLRSFLESALKSRPVFPTKQVTDLVVFIEARRSKSVELLTVLIAAAVGGIVGSLITLAAN